MTAVMAMAVREPREVWDSAVAVAGRLKKEEGIALMESYHGFECYRMGFEMEPTLLL